MNLVIKCSHCARKTSLTEAGARVAGWRIYRGQSMTGKDINDVLCPVHAGTGDMAEPIPTWHVFCRNCDWSTEEDPYPEDPPILTAYEATRVAKDHVCEPAFIYIDPEGNHLHDFTAEFQQQLRETTPKRK